MKHDHIGNLLAAQAMVEAMPNRAFMRHLKWFTNDAMMKNPHDCGSIGCFGGWIAVEPYFQKIGVQRTSWGAPLLGEECSMKFTSRILFGDSSMFDECYGELTEKEIILARIRRALESAIEAQT